MLGIKFELPNEYCNFIGKIFNGIDLKKQEWNIINSEVFDEKGNDLFEKNVYQNSEFQDMINNNEYYIVFLTLLLYNSDSKKINIKNFDDYYNSDCKLLLYVVDSIYIEIYAKSEALLNKITNNAKLNHFKNLEYINNKNEFKLYY